MSEANMIDGDAVDTMKTQSVAFSEVRFVGARSLVVGCATALVVACGGGSSDGIFGPSGTGTGSAQWVGDVDRRACGNGQGQAVIPLLRCIAPDPSAPIALAICGDLAAENTLTLDTRPSADGAALVVTGRTRVGSPLHVGGSFTSVVGIDGDNTEDIGGSLRTNGDWRVASPAHIGGDATVGGVLTANNTVDVGGTLRVASSTGSGALTSQQRIDGPISVPVPIDCTRGPDIAALVRAGGDPGAGHVSSAPLDALADVREKTTATLGCDRYHFSKVVAQNELVLRVEGNVVIVIDGDMQIKSPTRIELAPNATLDLAIGGSLEIDNTLSIVGGRAWVGVGRSVRIASPTQIEGWLIAPTATIEVANTLSITGGAFVGPVRVGSPVTFASGPAVALDGCVIE